MKIFVIILYVLVPFMASASNDLTNALSLEQEKFDACGKKIISFSEASGELLVNGGYISITDHDEKEIETLGNYLCSLLKQGEFVSLDSAMSNRNMKLVSISLPKTGSAPKNIMREYSGLIQRVITDMKCMQAIPEECKNGGF